MFPFIFSLLIFCALNFAAVMLLMTQVVNYARCHIITTDTTIIMIIVIIVIVTLILITIAITIIIVGRLNLLLLDVERLS